ncbi:hypothetical protein PENTCL1PPCAC_21930 [Pristionchus entomophagus]|uniref:Uncharacterized protein n=1 Tax=Pristionchus entomophagus TaxID=358040 RepID=A0AAV5TYY5_9BILA|nr:hypothetical protein PENTCL1PPCAC_21930 [Pristionchus entomophagus]
MRRRDFRDPRLTHLTPGVYMRNYEGTINNPPPTTRSPTPVTSEFVKRMQSTTYHHITTVHMGHLDAMNNDRLADKEAIEKRLKSFEQQLASLVTQAATVEKIGEPEVLVPSEKIDEQAEPGSDEFEVLDSSDKQRFENLVLSLDSAESSLDESRKQNTVLESDNLALKRRNEELEREKDDLKIRCKTC